MRHKHEHIYGSYFEDSKEYPYILEIISRDDTGRNDTFEVVWEENLPINYENAEEIITKKYIAKIETHQVFDNERLIAFASF